MEDILKKLMVPDSDAIKQASAELKTVFQKPEAIPELCNVMASSDTPQVRQYAAVLLRKRFTKSKNWNGTGAKLADNDRALIKSGCLQALVNEPEKSVKGSVAQLIAVLARHELASKAAAVAPGWPELMAFLDQAMKASEPPARQLGFQCLSALCDTAAEQMLVHIETLSPLLAAALQDESDRAVGFYAVKALTHLAPFVGSDQIKFVQPLVPHIIAHIKALLALNDERACEAMEVFDDLMECEVTIVVPYIKPILDLMLTVAAEKSLEDAVRVKAIVFLGMVVKMKKKTVIKNNLVPRMIEVLFPIMCEPTDEDEDDEDDEENDEESQSPSVCACQTLDQLAINLPPGKFLPHLMKCVQAGMASNDPHQVRAAYHAMAVCVEGCSEYIKNHHLAEFLASISNGVKSDNALVRNAALYALGQACEFLQPDINDHVKEFLPILVNYLDTATAQLKQTEKGKVKGLDRIFYALEVFSESLGPDLLPYLEEMLKRLVNLIGPQFSNRVQELAISLIGTCATSVAEAIAPYAKDIIAHLQPYLTLECNEENQVLMMQSMDTLGSMARAIGPTGFAPALASECANLGLTLIDSYDDPDVRKCCYSLLASVASIAKEDMETILPKLVPVVLLSVASNEGISFEFKDEDSGLPVEDLSDGEDDEGKADEEISLEDDDTEAEDDDQGLDKVKTISVENSFMEEKQQAIIALRDMCADTGSAFHEFLAPAFEAVWKVIDYPDEDIRRASVDAITQFTVAYYKAGEPALKEFNNSVTTVIPKLCTMIKEDDEVGVASIALESISELLKECKGGVTSQPGYPEAIVETIQSVLKSDCACMDKDEVEDDAADEEQEAEQDEALFDCAGEILPNLGLAMTPQTFLPIFQGLFPMILKKTKKQCSPSERSFAIGSFAECMEPLAGCLEPFVSDLMPLFVGFMNDGDKDVRNNAIYGLGELALNGGPGMVQHYPQLLQTLSNHLGKGDEARCVDQIVGAVCRLVVANKAAVPLTEVLPVIFQHLPLKEDKEEYAMVYRCLQTVYDDCRELILQNIQKIGDMSASLLNDKAANETKVKPLAKATVQALCKDHAEQMKAALANQTPETIAKFEL